MYVKTADRGRSKLSARLRFRLGRVRNRLRVPLLWPHRLLAARLGRGRFPDFIIIGAQKAGTKSLYNYLIQHPDVKAARRKEVHYFDLNHEKSASWYQSYFPLVRRAAKHRISGEASPYYIFHPLVPERIAASLPKVKLIALLRNPIDRAYSHYQHSVKFGFEKAPFDEALRRERELLPAETAHLRSDPGYRSFAHRHYSYVSRGLYAEQLERWLRFFTADQLLILKSEELFTEPERTFLRVVRFLELREWSTLEWRVYNPGSYSERLDPDVRDRLRQLFHPHNQRLAELTGIAVDDWV